MQRPAIKKHPAMKKTGKHPSRENHRSKGSHRIKAREVRDAKMSKFGPRSPETSETGQVSCNRVMKSLAAVHKHFALEF